MNFNASLKTFQQFINAMILAEFYSNLPEVKFDNLSFARLPL